MMICGNRLNLSLRFISIFFLLSSSLLVSPQIFALSASDEQKVRVLLKRGEHYRDLLEIDKQVTVLTEALRIDPKNPGILNLRAAAYTDINDFENAIDDYSAALKLRQSSSYYRERAYCYFKMNKGEASIADYSKAVAMGDRDANIYRLRGRTYARMNKNNEAIQDYEKCLSLTPRHSDRLEHETMNFLGSLYLKTQQYEKAVALYTKLISYFPDLGKGYYGRAKAYTALGKLDLAKKDNAKGQDMDYLLDPSLKPRK